MNPLFANVALDFFLRGGPIMWPILVCLIAALAVVAERALWWASLARRSAGGSLSETFEAVGQGRFEHAVKLTRQANDPYLATVHEGLLHAHTSLLGAMQLRATDEIEHAEKRLWVLSTFITLAPLLGLLGTVTGMIHAFGLIGGELDAPTAITGGVAEALIATAFGLGIAITALLPFNFLNARTEDARHEIEDASTHLELLLKAGDTHEDSFTRR